MSDDKVKADGSGPRQTDKGRTRPSSSTSSSSKPTSSNSKKKPSKALSAQDYSRTTDQSPSSTAVIPAVKDDVPEPQTPAAPAAPTDGTAPSGRTAALRLTHIEPWSVTRMAFVISVAMMIVGVVATTIFWIVLSITGVWDQLSDSVTAVLSDSDDAFDITEYLGFGRLVGLSLLLSVVNVVVMTVLATIAAHLYNLAAHVIGGIQVTFSNDQ